MPERNPKFAVDRVLKVIRSCAMLQVALRFAQPPSQSARIPGQQPPAKSPIDRSLHRVPNQTYGYCSCSSVFIRSHSSRISPILPLLVQRIEDRHLLHPPPTGDLRGDLTVTFHAVAEEADGYNKEISEDLALRWTDRERPVPFTVGMVVWLYCDRKHQIVRVQYEDAGIVLWLCRCRFRHRWPLPLQGQLFKFAPEPRKPRSPPGRRACCDKPTRVSEHLWSKGSQMDVLRPEYYS